MSKRHTQIPLQWIEQEKKTHGETILFSHEDAARLRHITEWGTNGPRLYNNLTNRCKIGLRDLIYLLNQLPDTYRYKIFQDYDFEPFLRTLLQSTSSVDKKTKNKKNLKYANTTLEKGIQNHDAYSFNVSVMMFNHSVEYIINTMPPEFRDSLARQIYPFVTLINSISNFSNRNLNVKLPYIAIPSTIIPTELQRIGFYGN